MTRIILASGSPRRKELLEQAGFRFEVVVSDADETIGLTEPDQVVEELSRIKAKAVADQIQGDALVIGADTIVAADGQILGKPRDEEDARRMLLMLQGHTHQVYTGVTVIQKRDGAKRAGGSSPETEPESFSPEMESESFSQKTEVTMYGMSEKEIHDYIATGEPMDKAGAYGIQGRAAVFVEKINGDYNNVVGLPVGRLYQTVKHALERV